MTTATARTPTIFVPHGGGPIPILQPTSELSVFLSTRVPELLKLNTSPPEAIVVVTAHWEEKNVTISSADSHSLYFDYYNFPAETYKYKYPAPGHPAVAKRVRELLAANNIASDLNETRGWDHGVFVPMLLIHPSHSIPIVQVSLQASLDPQLHLAIGRALAPLRDENVVIIGSGMTFHNMGAFFGGPVDKVQRSKAFDEALTSAITNSSVEEREKGLSKWSELKEAKFAHPREEHLLPLMVIAGAAGSDKGRKVFESDMAGCAISSFLFE